MALDEVADKILKDDSAQKKAVEALIELKPLQDKNHTETEIKTDFENENTVIAHTVADTINQFIFDSKNFGKLSVLGRIVDKKERKLLSLKRRSRTEIVEVAKNPDMSINDMQSVRGEGAVRKFFAPRR